MTGPFQTVEDNGRCQRQTADPEGWSCVSEPLDQVDDLLTTPLDGQEYVRLTVLYNAVRELPLVTLRFCGSALAGIGLHRRQWIGRNGDTRTFVAAMSVRAIFLPRGTNSTNIRRRIKGTSKVLFDALARIKRVAATQLPVLIRGETGTGKELVARLVHDESERRRGPYKPVNCAAIPETLLESMLFGHKRGAFTGALEQRGIFLAATGGTLFLDEIGEMPLSLQVKVLRVLEEATIRPLGSDADIRVDVRIVSASHRDLQKMVATGDFRRDLYHRLKVYAVDLPALRERGRDIVILARYFLKRLYPSKRLSRDTEQLLLSQKWPGNIRELSNVIEAASVDAGRTVHPKHVLYHLDSDGGVFRTDANGSPHDKILAVVGRTGSASPAEIREEVSLPRTTVRRALNGMVAAEVLQRIGGGRRTRYAKPNSANTDPVIARQLLTVQYVEEAGRITRNQCTETTGTSIRTAGRDLGRLVKLGRLVQDGQNGNAGGYVLASRRPDPQASDD